jgi:hypothetical protein
MLPRLLPFEFVSAMSLLSAWTVRAGEI